MLIKCYEEHSVIFLPTFHSESSFPSSRKTATVVPIFKNSGDRSDPLNYRPISHLNIISKVYESLINKTLVSHMESNGQFSDTQYGFRSTHSRAVSREKLIGSILGPLLFNIFINDIFLFLQETEICNFADDNTFFACDTSVETVISRLKNDLDILNIWFIDNSLVANPAKFQLMFLGVKNIENLSISIYGNEIDSQTEVELLGLTIDHKL